MALGINDAWLTLADCLITGSRSLNIAYLGDFSRCLAHPKTSLVSRKALAVVMPFGSFAAKLIAYVEVMLPICVPLTCQRLLTKSIITPYTLS